LDGVTCAACFFAFFFGGGAGSSSDSLSVVPTFSSLSEEARSKIGGAFNGATAFEVLASGCFLFIDPLATLFLAEGAVSTEILARRDEEIQKGMAYME
jgi:hypothetical protein